jgi:hypothetical protein
MSYYARFETVADHVFRFDTRIYLSKHDPQKSGKCVGAIIGKNPGSAKPTQLGVWAPLNLDGDKMLPSVRNRFVDAYKQAGKEIPVNAFVQVWNLFYLCNPNLEEACSIISSFVNLPRCPSENRKPRVVWFAWGGNDSRLNPFKQRFISSHHPSFYYNHQSSEVIGHIPSADDFAKHPQGMPAIPVINYLAGVL